jgi:hypothetical protein
MFSRRYLDTAHTSGTAREHTGGSFSSGSNRSERRDIRVDTTRQGSHMPIDTDIHWTWRNPLNIIPAFVLVCIVIAVVGTIVSAF